jgi:hypothetical protein
MKKFIDGLSVDEAARVLRDMLGKDPDLMKKAYEIAVKVAGDVDADVIMDRVFRRLDMLDLDDLSGRAGRTRHGYVEPTDAAWELFEEALDPFIHEMKRNQERGLLAAGKAHCIGIIKGLWMYEAGSSSDFSGWVVDAPGEYVGTVVDEWKKGNPPSEDIAEIMDIARGART